MWVPSLLNTLKLSSVTEDCAQSIILPLARPETAGTVKVGESGAPNQEGRSGTNWNKVQMMTAAQNCAATMVAKLEHCHCSQRVLITAPPCHIQCHSLSRLGKVCWCWLSGRRQKFMVTSPESLKSAYVVTTQMLESNRMHITLSCMTPPFC